MEQYYLALVFLLMLLAITDLVVGVSNDAVNFLNSSIGSKVATRRTIMLIAAAGIFTGALFSSGMMEIARKGIFVPELFFFDEVLIIFLAVMLTDILLLDLFNTFGMPTSTTVSIIFELLGASVLIAGIKVFSQGESIDAISAYINSAKALTIISGIFLSVFLAFTLGAFVQFVTRIIFSFHYWRTQPILRIIFVALCFTSLSYFLVFEGLHGASFISVKQLDFIRSNMLWLVHLTLVFWVLLAVVLHQFQVNLFKLVVLFGTFSLAMAFAGNDLVNFIGVSIAGLESFQLWSVSGAEPGSFTMEALSEPIQTKTYLLILAGLIMVLTLWFSRKAQTVTDTEVNLSRQHEGSERFESNRLSEFIVSIAVTVNSALKIFLSDRVLNMLNRRFQPLEINDQSDQDLPAFDLIRASINLTVASILISIATNYKLPLSTTYVSFMVAMGSSLADRAWSSQSAAQRIAGVLNVIGGWFLTAMIAFSVAAIFALIIHLFDGIGVALLVAAVSYSIYRTFRYHKRKFIGSSVN